MYNFFLNIIKLLVSSKFYDYYYFQTRTKIYTWNIFYHYFKHLRLNNLHNDFHLSIICNFKNKTKFGLVLYNTRHNTFSVRMTIYLTLSWLSRNDNHDVHEVNFIFTVSLSMITRTTLTRGVRVRRY